MKNDLTYGTPQPWSLVAFPAPGGVGKVGEVRESWMQHTGAVVSLLRLCNGHQGLQGSWLWAWRYINKVQLLSTISPPPLQLWGRRSVHCSFILNYDPWSKDYNHLSTQAPISISRLWRAFSSTPSLLSQAAMMAPSSSGTWKLVRNITTCLFLNNEYLQEKNFIDFVCFWTTNTCGKKITLTLFAGDFIRDLVALESGGSGGVVWRIRSSPTKLVRILPLSLYIMPSWKHTFTGLISSKCWTRVSANLFMYLFDCVFSRFVPLGRGTVQRRPSWWFWTSTLKPSDQDSCRTRPIKPTSLIEKNIETSPRNIPSLKRVSFGSQGPLTECLIFGLSLICSTNNLLQNYFH